MAELILTVQYNKDSQLSISPSELIEQYFFGIPMCNTNGQELTQRTIKEKILIAQRSVENILNIKLFQQLVVETTNFVREEWGSWSYVQTTYQVYEPVRMEGFYNGVKQISYPKQWITTRKEYNSLSDDNVEMFHQMYIIPVGNSSTPSVDGVIFNGIVPFAGLLGLNYIPNYWRASYITGFKKIPLEIMDIIAKLAAIQLFAILGDLYLGIGISNQSISLDGLSQSISSVRNANAGIYNARIIQYTNDIKDKLEYLKGKYKGFTFGVV